VPRITGSPAYADGGLLIVTFDEADSDNDACCNEQPGPNTPNPAGPSPGPGGGKTGAVFLSPYIQPGSVNNTPYNHYSMLRSVEDAFGLPHLAFAAADGLKPFGDDVFNNPSGNAVPPVTPPGGGGSTPKAARLKIRFGGVPKRCVAGSFKARVSIAATRGLKRARATVDRHTKRRSSKRRFSVKVRTGALRHGKHRLTVVAADKSGKRVRRTAVFRRC
jgi:hypothetical protein